MYQEVPVIEKEEIMEVMNTANPSTITDQSERLVEKKEEKEGENEEDQKNASINGDKLLCSELCSMDEAEKSRVDKMRDLLKTQVSDSDNFEELDDFALRRFLRARDQDVDKALKMLMKHQKWRRSFVQNGSISESEVPNEIAQNKFFMQGHDKKGRPVAVLLASRHKQAQRLDEFKRYVVYCLDKVCARMPIGHEKFVAIGDLRGWGYANSDVRGYLAALSLLQDCYPERVEKVFIINAPYIFMAVWRIVYPLIDDKTRKKYIFVENENLKPTLLSEIDESQLPVEYGGKLSLVPISDC